MMRSLYSAVAGLKNHQIKMDVIGNNIANVNTVAYRPSRVVFSDVYSQTIRPASAADNNVAKVGGVNPVQIGLGMSIATVDVMQARPTAQATGEAFDLMISGEGYFVVNVKNENVFTRAGNFYLDATNNLVTQSGAYVMGFSNSQQSDNSANDRVIVDVNATPPETYTHFSLNTPTPWDPMDDTTPFPTNVNTTNLKPITIDPNFKDVTVGASGEIIGTHKDTGEKFIIGQIMIATFDNTSGLAKVGTNLLRETANSGASTVQRAQVGAAGAVTSGYLEMANVDISQEFSDMITTQRGFQANSRIITVSDSMLEELINLKR